MMRLHRLSLIFGVLVAGAATSAMAQDLANILGRWKEINGTVTRKEVPIKHIDVIPCYGHICVIHVSESGVCKPPIMVVSAKPNEAFKQFADGTKPHSGTFVWDDENGTGFIRPINGQLSLVGYQGEDAGSVLARAFPIYGSRFERDGPALCPPPKVK